MNSPRRLLSRVLTSALAVCLLSACVSPTTVTLEYQPRGGAWRGQPEINVGAFANKRGIDSRNLGRVKLFGGVPVQALFSSAPVEMATANAFAYALKERNLLTGGDTAKFLLTGDVLVFDAGVMTRPSAHVRIRVNLIEMDSGRVLFTKVYHSDRSNEPMMPGKGGAVPVVTEMASRCLQDVVDRAVDDPELRSRMRLRAQMPMESEEGAGDEKLLYPKPKFKPNGGVI